jgi:hypothetical protein
MATIASLLRERATLQVNSVDRMFLAGYVPKLQSEGQVVRFLLDRGFPIPSPAALGKIGAAYVRAVERFASRNRIPVVHFKTGESKELAARRYMQKAEREGRFGVVMIGVAQEKTSAWRGFRRGGPDSHPHFSYAGCRCSPTTSISTSAIASSVPLSSRPSPTPHTECGCTSMVMSGPSVRPPSGGSALRRWITGSCRSRTPTSSRASATASGIGTSSASGSTGSSGCPRRSPHTIASAATATACQSASSSCPTRACPSAPRRYATGSS